jgi:hypothetical protein
MPHSPTLSHVTLKKKLRPLLKPYWAKRIATYAGFADSRYVCPTMDEIRQIMDTLELPEPGGELYDCDDFAYALKAHVSRTVRLSDTWTDPLAVGIAWARFVWIGRGRTDHACNWVLDAEGTFHWIEPQNRRFYDLNQCRGWLNLLLV